MRKIKKEPQPQIKPVAKPDNKEEEDKDHESQFKLPLVSVQTSIKNIITINLDEEIISPHYYRDAFRVLSEACEHDLVIIKLNTPGGAVDTFIQFYNCIRNCDATVVADVYRAYSAGSLIMLAADEIIINDFASVMVHSCSYEVFGQEHQIESMQRFMKSASVKMYLELYSGFLSKEEIDKVNSGQELWFNADETKNRLKKRADYLLKKEKELNKIEKKK